MRNSNKKLSLRQCTKLLDRKSLSQIIALLLLTPFLIALDFMSVLLLTSLLSFVQNSNKTNSTMGLWNQWLEKIGSETTRHGFYIVIILIVCTIVFRNFVQLLQYRTLINILTKQVIRFSEKMTLSIFSTINEFQEMIAIIEHRNRLKSNELAFKSHTNIEILFLNFFFSGVTLFIEYFFASVVLLTILFISPVTFLIILPCSVAVLFIIQKRQSTRVSTLGSRLNDEAIKSNEKFLEFVPLIHEIGLRGSAAAITPLVQNHRTQVSRIRATLAYLPIVNKFRLETLITVSVVLVVFLQTLNQQQDSAQVLIVATIVALVRLLPGLLRIQNAHTSMRTNHLLCQKTLAGLLKLPRTSFQSVQAVPELDTRISINRLAFRYEGQKTECLSIDELNLKSPKSYAIMGKSGSGKSTLLKILAGEVDVPKEMCSIDGLQPLEWSKLYPGKLSLVAQQTFFFSGTLRENIQLGLPNQTISHWDKILNVSGCQEFLDDLPHGIDSRIDEINKLSGGQIQRLAIARALYSLPKILIMDEPFSSLDEKIEFEVIKKLLSQEGVLLIFSTHRVKTGQMADMIINLDHVRNYD